MDKLLKKLKKILSKLGVDEKTQDQVMNLLDAEDDEETTPVVEEEVKEEPVVEEAPVVEGEGETPSEEPAPVEEPDAEPTEPTPETPLPVGAEEVDPSQMGAEPVAEPTPTPIPDVNPTVELDGKIAEQKQLIEALQAKISSLEEALTKSGILTTTGEKAEGYGVDQNSTPANNPIDDPVQSVLNEINGRRGY